MLPAGLCYLADFFLAAFFFVLAPDLLAAADLDDDFFLAALLLADDFFDFFCPNAVAQFSAYFSVDPVRRMVTVAPPHLQIAC